MLTKTLYNFKGNEAKKKRFLKIVSYVSNGRMRQRLRKFWWWYCLGKGLKFQALFNNRASSSLASEFRDVSTVKDIQTWKWEQDFVLLYSSQFQENIQFLNPLKTPEARVFLIFSGGIGMEHWTKCINILHQKRSQDLCKHRRCRASNNS